MIKKGDLLKTPNLYNLTNNEDGNIAVITALLVSVFFGLLALVVDIGYFYEGRRQLQTAADAAALAAMSNNIKGHNEAQIKDTAKVYAEKNDFGSDDKLYISNTEITDEYVKVAVKKKLNTFFAFIGAGPSEKTISAQAKAKKVYLTGVTNVVPLGIVKQEFSYGESYSLWSSDSPTSGNFGALDFTLITKSSVDGIKNADDLYVYYLKNSYDEDYITTKTSNIQSITGNKSKITGDALNTRISECSKSFADWSLTKDIGCKRLLTVLIINSIPSGSKKVTIVSFGLFFLENIESKGSDLSITGRFVEYTKPGRSQDGNPGDPSILSVRLDVPDY